MSDKKEKTKNEDKEVKPDTILINTMYTGNYTNENIGHEIINLYKTDKGENYIYISPYGTLADERYDTIDAVLLARPAGKGRLEIIAKATGLTPQNKSENEKELNFKDEDKINQILKERGLLGLTPIQIKQKLYYDWIVKNNEGIKTISDKFIMSRKIVTQEEMRNIQCDFVLKQLSNDKEYEEIKNKSWNSKDVTKKKEELIKNYEKLTLEVLVKELNDKCSSDFSSEVDKLSEYAATPPEIEKDKLEDYFEKTKFRRDWKRVTPMHQPQINYIKTNNIKYGNKLINEILDVNYHRIPPVYLTFKAEKVVRPNKPIYIEYISSKKENNTTDNNDEQTEEMGELSKKEKANAKFMGMYDNGKSITYKFQDIKFRNQSCMKYLKDGKNDFIKELEKIQKKYNEKDEIHTEIKDILTKLSENNEYFDSQQEKLSTNIQDIFKDKNEYFKNLKNILDSREPKIYKYFCENIINNNEIWKKEDASTKIVENDDDTNAYEQFFLDITGNQYDELAYSNMFSYFFKKYPEIFVCFANEVLNVKDVNTTNTFEVIREENNVDILIETDNDIFVIENKVKSHINGEKYIDDTSQNTNNSEEHNGIDSANKKNDIVETDKKGIEYTNQLIKYYNYVESKYPQYKNKHYYIFKPDYNNTEEELRQKIEKIKNKAEIEPIINEYHHINYSVIFNFYKNKPKEWLCKTLGSDNGKSAGNEDSKKVQYTEQIITDYVYFKDFIRALKRHINPTDNTNELIMKYKFKQAIKKAQNGENPCPNLTEWCDSMKLSAGGSPDHE